MREKEITILRNANIITMDPRAPRLNAVAIEDGRISKRQTELLSLVGSGDKTFSQAGERSGFSIRAIDLKGKTVVPGFIDCHTHFLQMGVRLSQMDLGDTESIAEASERIEEKAKESEKGAWIVGNQWDDGKWKEKRYITKDDIDKVAPENPVVLKRVCMHVWVASSKALEVANIPADEPGLERSSTGEPTGALRWRAKDYAQRHLNPSGDELDEALKLARQEAFRLGVTSVHEWSPNVAVLERAVKRREPMVRDYLGFSYADFDALESIGFTTGFGDELLKVGAIKMFADGSIGARSAAVGEPYCDDPGNLGQLAWDQEKLNETVAQMHRAGWQIAIHAIGDRGIAAALEAIERTLRDAPRDDHRHRIEHAEILNEELMNRIRDAGVIVSGQPNFVGEWLGEGKLYEMRLGVERFQHNNPFGQLRRKGIPLAFGSDGMPFGPLYGIHSVVNHPIKESRMSISEALHCYTLGAAYSSFEEDIKGAIEPGKLADMAVLSNDPMKVDRDKIKDIQVEMTMVGGRLQETTSEHE